MEYLLLTYQSTHTITEADFQGSNELYHANILALRERDCLRLAACLPYGSDTTPLTLCNGELSVNEQGISLTGVYLIRAKDINDAIRTASRLPEAQGGTIEVRAVEELIIDN